jgi:hypothetical protein
VHAVGKRPHLDTRGMGVHAVGKRPHLDTRGMGEPYNENIYKWFQDLSERLRYVRVVCGDWSRVCGGNWQDSFGEVGIFLDPPYGITDRDTKLYHCDSTKIAADVLAWCRERGKIKSYRIVIAGYEEYLDLEKIGWRVKQWKTGGGYSNMNKLEEKSQGQKNAIRERLYFSPYCMEKQLKFV